MSKEERTLQIYLQAVALFSVHFPHTLQYADCLNNIANLYSDMKKADTAKKHYLQAIALYSVHFSHTLEYADCLNNLTVLYSDMKKQVEAAEVHFSKAISLYSTHFPSTLNYTNCLHNFGDFLKSRGHRADRSSPPSVPPQPVCRCSDELPDKAAATALDLVVLQARSFTLPFSHCPY